MQHDEKAKYVLHSTLSYVLANTGFTIIYFGTRNKRKDTIFASSKTFFGLKKSQYLVKIRKNTKVSSNSVR